jgi:hypothetical protein
MARGTGIAERQRPTPVQPPLTGRLQAFQQDLKNRDALDLFQTWVLRGVPVVYTDDVYQRLKKTIATRLSLNLVDVIMIGSAKLGFSLTSAPRFKLFSGTSDVDISIISPRLFEELWNQAHRFSTALRNPNDFYENLFLGRIHPNTVAPSNDTFRFRELQELQDYLNQQAVYGRNSKHILVLRSWEVFQRTQCEVIEACRG